MSTGTPSATQDPAALDQRQHELEEFRPERFPAQRLLDKVPDDKLQPLNQVMNESDRKPDAERRISDAQPDKSGTNFRSREPGYHPLRKIRIGLSGIRQAVLLDFTVRFKLALSLVFLAIAGAYETLFHFLFVLTVTGVMLLAEILNTCVEALCDLVQPGYDERIKQIKDMAAGAALIAIVIWYVVLGVVLCELLFARELFSANHS